LIELLVTVAIIGVLLALLLSAVQAARESARRKMCANNLKQVGIGSLLHLDQHGFLPTGGWGHGWTGDSDRGYGRDQPGGWVYNILDYIDEAPLRAQGAGLSPAQKKAAAAGVIATPIAILNCPTRGRAQPSPNTKPRQDYNTDTPEIIARADYAANCGTEGSNVLSAAGGPATLVLGDTTYLWPSPKSYTGVCFVRSEVSVAKIADGTTKTYLIGEKYLNPEVYDTGDDPSDWAHMYVGHGAETLRIARDFALPRQDRFPISDHRPFGSAHEGAYQMLFCDGSVQSLSYEIDPLTHERLGNRIDGAPIAFP
jgi:hypothetical protein